MQTATTFFAEQTVETISPFLTLGAHVAFGGGLFYGVQKFFEEVEKKLSKDTKLEIAVWLLDLRPAEAIERWPPTFIKLFNQVFGEKHISWKCLWRSWLTSAITTATVLVGAAALLGIQLQSYYGPVPDRTVVVIGLSCILIGNFLPDYVSLWKTRYLLKLSIKRSRVFEQILSLIADFLLSIPLAICAFVIEFLVTFVVLGHLNSRLLSGGKK